MFETVQDYMYEHEPRRRCARTGPVHNCEYSIMWKVLHIFHGYVASDRAVYTPLVRGFASTSLQPHQALALLSSPLLCALRPASTYNPI